MSHQQNVSLASVLEIFSQEIVARSGEVHNVVQDKSRLFARSVVPSVAEVLPNDQLQGGVALRATESEVWLSPYVFRLVCSNGAIMAHALQTQHLSDLDWQIPWLAEGSLHEAIQACYEPGAFASAVQEFRLATKVFVVPGPHLLSWLGQFGLSSTGLYQEIMDQFFREPDETRFDLTNAVTAVARETRNPEVRWRLEELGGAIAAGQVDPSPSRSPQANHRRRHSIPVLSVASPSRIQ